jgi:hypothetical protein
MIFARALRALLLFSLTMIAVPAFAQQTGAISGKVTDPAGLALPGVTVEARADVLPGPRVTVTGPTGDYRLPQLPPGSYTLTFTLAGMQSTTRQAQVLLSQDSVANASLGLQGVAESVTVTAEPSLIDKDSAMLKSGLTSDQIRSLPVGQEYRDIVKLIPGVQFSQDTVRGPSAGGSGQDNVYQFDGVNVTLPLFGTLSAEPATHDIAQVTTVKGGARAVDFDRSGGFSIDSVSKSGTSRYSGMASFQFQSSKMAADVKSGTRSRYEQDRTWTTLNAGGPLVRDRLFFYGSYYRPTNSRANQANDYGALPEYQSTRNEGFGKLTFTPLNTVLVNVSYRDSHRLEKGDVFLKSWSATSGTGNEAWLKIGTAEGSWLINARSYATFKLTHFANETLARPDTIANVTVSSVIGTPLDTSSLNTQGRLSVPIIIAGQTAYNAFVQPLIDRFGYIDESGARAGGGINGYGLDLTANDFFRDAGQIGYNLNFGGAVSHDLHFGYQLAIDSEDLLRSSNGWGLITVPGGRTSFQGTPIFYTATYAQQSGGNIPPIHSEYRSQSFEVNDTIRLKNWTINAGLLLSNDSLHGQDLKNDDSALSGFVYSAGSKYKMYEIPFSKMVQPRVSATWAYNGKDTVYASYAKYNPAASSLPRAASWARNRTTTVDAHFDANGRLFATTPVASSSGKLFVPDMTPRTVNEFVVGTARQLGRRLTGRAYARYREADHFWEDTNNTARVTFNPPAGIPREPYIPNLTDQLAQIQSGSSYVIAELDGAYTKYYEATLEAEWRGNKTFVRGSYTWSHYYGNFDQDNTTTVNDANSFIGSSFIADAAGRQLWDFRDGTLRGDRPHMLKVYGFYSLDWNATAGAYFIAQSGQPWEMWSYEPYRALTTSISDVSRYAETAGSRRSPSHWQLDLNYTQNLRVRGRTTVQLVADLFNVQNKQTGYNFQQQFHLSDFGLARTFYDPRRFQLAVRVQF